MLREEDIISSHYSVVQYDHRSKIFIVEKGSLKGLFVKQIKESKSPLLFLLQKDATTLWNIKHEPVFQALRSSIASYLGYDVDHQALITEYNVDHINLEQGLSENRVVDEALLLELLQLLQLVHIPFSKLPETPSIYFYPRSKPWIFEILSYDEYNRFLLPHYTPICQAVMGHAAFKIELDKAIDEWQLDTFIHGDIKWTNFLISNDINKTDIKLIDWEMADIGDPIWDVAGLIQCILKDGILNRNEAVIDVFNIHQSSDSFELVCYIIKNYFKKSEILNLEEPSVSKVIRYSMLRLLQSACELNDFDMQLKPITLLVLQAVHYMAEHIEDIASLVSSKIEAE